MKRSRFSVPFLFPRLFLATTLPSLHSFGQIRSPAHPREGVSSQPHLSILLFLAPLVRPSAAVCAFDREVPTRKGDIDHQNLGSVSVSRLRQLPRPSIEHTLGHFLQRQLDVNCLSIQRNGLG